MSNSTDLKRLNTISLKAVTSGMVIIGGGVVKHHICNANLMVRMILFELSFLDAYNLLNNN